VAAVLLEEQAHVKHRLLEHAGLDQHQHDQQPALAAIAIEKRVDPLELQVGQGGAHQHRQGVLIVVAAMVEPLQLRHAVFKVPRRRYLSGKLSAQGA
jgi:hypothetical protein